MAYTSEVKLSLEAEMERLGELNGTAPPVFSAGHKIFVESFNKWINSADKKTVVLPDPALNLSLPYPDDELDFASTLASIPIRNNAFFEKFGLSPEVLNRPIIALSGGERILVSFAKAVLLASRTKNLIVCSPFYWLDAIHRVLVENILTAYKDEEVTIHLLTLDGEINEGNNAPVLTSEIPLLEWHIKFSNLNIVFPAIHFPQKSEEKKIEFFLPGGEYNLQSPTLISGPNGIGKSTLVKVLAGLLVSKEYKPHVIVNGFSGNGKARLLMQDVNLHLFSDSPIDHLNRVFSSDKKRKDDALAIFSKLQLACVKDLCLLWPSFSIGDKSEPNTILQVKLALIAERLVDKPNLLVLDEPGWCLTKAAAQILFREVVRCAHEFGTAIAIISHQTAWWDLTVRSEIRLSETSDLNRVEVIKVR